MVGLGCVLVLLLEVLEVLAMPAEPAELQLELAVAEEKAGRPSAML